MVATEASHPTRETSSRSVQDEPTDSQEEELTIPTNPYWHLTIPDSMPCLADLPFKHGRSSLRELFSLMTNTPAVSSAGKHNCSSLWCCRRLKEPQKRPEDRFRFQRLGSSGDELGSSISGEI
jgi:hypothetical protein